MRCLAACRYVLALAIAFAALGKSAAADDLYRTQAIVTGQGAAERARGFALCLEAVLVKVSGEPRLIDDPRLVPLKEKAASFVAGFDYRDRMQGIPVHDEQGTRDRPFDLTVTFDPWKIDAALRSLALAPWPEPRPRLAVLLGVRDATAAYVLAEDGERGLGQRQSLAAAAARRGLVLLLPQAAVLSARHVTYRRLAAMGSSRRRALARESGGEAALAGTLVWTEAALGWTARWHFSWRGRAYRWHLRGVSFDDAFRHVVDRAVAVLSGHGA
ncbi:MAG TPA: DUF2066 domain-containing protein [Stellaceae bacterium]|nr:DUF2066 domain-containing protein [Stellaceae bacterium]